MYSETSGQEEEADLVLLALEKEIAALPEKQREAIVLQYYQGMSGAEIAAAMHCARGAVAALIHRGMEKLRTRLAKVGMGDLELESTLSSSALLLPVPAGLWVKLSEVLSGQLAGGPVAELVKDAIQEMLWAKVKAAVALAAGVVLTGAGGYEVYRLAMSERAVAPVAEVPAATTTAVAPAAEPEKVYRFWTFKDGPAKDLQVVQGGWHWEKGRSGVGLMVPDNGSNTTVVALPVKVPARPVILTLKGERETSGKDQGRTEFESSWLAEWVTERGQLAHRRWKAEEISTEAESWKRVVRFVFIRRYICVLQMGKVPALLEYDGEYPGNGIVWGFNHFLPEELELRELTPSEAEEYESMVQKRLAELKRNSIEPERFER